MAQRLNNRQSTPSFVTGTSQWTGAAAQNGNKTGVSFGVTFTAAPMIFIQVNVLDDRFYQVLPWNASTTTFDWYWRLLAPNTFATVDIKWVAIGTLA